MRKLLYIILFSLLATACGEFDVWPSCGEGFRRDAEIDTRRALMSAVSFFRRDAGSIGFLSENHYEETDLKWGVARGRRLKDYYLLQVPVLHDATKTGCMKDVLYGHRKRTYALVLVDADYHVCHINFTDDLPTADYYENHGSHLFYDEFTGEEHAYTQDAGDLITLRYMAGVLLRTRAEEDTSVAWTDTLDEVVVIGHHDMDGDDDDDEWGDPFGDGGQDTTSVDGDGNGTVLCPFGHGPMSYEQSGNKYVCLVCLYEYAIPQDVGGGTLAGGQSGGKTVTGYAQNGYKSDYRKFQKSEFKPGDNVRRYNPNTSSDKRFVFASCTPTDMIGQSSHGCVVACVNHMLMAYGMNVRDESAVWHRYYTIYQRSSGDIYAREDEIKDIGVYGSFVESLLKDNFTVRELRSIAEARRSVLGGKPVYIEFTMSDGEGMTQRHAEVLYGVMEISNLLALFDSNYQDIVVRDATDLGNDICLYEITGLKH